MGGAADAHVLLQEPRLRHVGSARGGDLAAPEAGRPPLRAAETRVPRGRGGAVFFSSLSFSCGEGWVGKMWRAELRGIVRICMGSQDIFETCTR